MAEWCMEHPWMTFILIITFLSSIKIGIKTENVEKRIKMEARIRELEELLCPCEQHDWVQTKLVNCDDGTQEQYYMCRRCKKEKVE